MPDIRPFRALRFDEESVGDLARVVSPPYDVISPAQLRVLLARHPRNAVRLDLPVDEPGEEPDMRYRRTARTYAAWRSDGTLHKEAHPSVYVYEQTYVVPGTDVERTQRGFFARVRLEPFGADGGILRHERTMAAPKEDRYKLLRATGANMSPVVAVYEDRTGRSVRLLADVASNPADVELTDEDGVRHRLWVLAEDGPGGETVRELIEIAGSESITIADGHHRYETALRYRDERRMTRSCDTDPAYDFILMLLLDAAGQELTVLPTHRVILGVGDEGVEGLWSNLGELFEATPVDRAQLEDRFASAALAAGGGGRFGLWTRGRGALLQARRAAFDAGPKGDGRSVERLDVSILQVALERLLAVDEGLTTHGGRIAYTKSAAEAIEWVEARAEDADVAFLLEPTPISSIVEVARQGDVMPPKSTYFHPKALTGLLINPHEW